MNPMKIYEYLACGKPVVSSYDFGLDYLSEYIKVADNYQKFNQAVNQELDSDNPAKAEKRQQTAQANSWDNRYRQMWQIIENKQIK